MVSDCGKYYTDKYELNDNRIKLTAERRSSNGIFYGWNDVRNSYLYHEKSIKGLTGTPDW